MCKLLILGLIFVFEILKVVFIPRKLILVAHITWCLSSAVGSQGSLFWEGTYLVVCRFLVTAQKNPTLSSTGQRLLVWIMNVWACLAA